MKKRPRAFVSYTWDNEDHKKQVKDLAVRLCGDGIDVVLDDWSNSPGAQLPQFMETAVRESDAVIIICTPRYRERFDDRRGGAGYEGHMITAELLQGGNQEKFFTLLWQGEPTTALPSALAGKRFLDFRDRRRDDRYHELVRAVYGLRPERPEIGPPPSWVSAEEDLIVELRTGLYAELLISLRNLGLTAVRQCKVSLVGLNRFVERRNDFTQETLPERAVLLADLEADSASPARRFSEPDYSASRLLLLEAPRSDYPLVRDKHVYALTFVTAVEDRTVQRTVRFVRHRGPGKFEVVGDPRELPPEVPPIEVPAQGPVDSEHYEPISPDDLPAIESAGGPPATAQIGMPSSITGILSECHVYPTVPRRAVRDSFRVVEETPECYRLEKVTNANRFLIPKAKVRHTLPGDDVPTLELDGRLQWLTIPERWRYFPEPIINDQEFGNFKRSFIGDPAVAKLESNLASRGRRVTWVALNRVAEFLSQGSEVFYDDDGLALVAGGELILVASKM